VTGLMVGIHVHAEPSRLLGTLDALEVALPSGADIVLLPDGPDDETCRALSGVRRLRNLPQSATDASCGPPACFNRLIAGASIDVVVLLESGVRPAPDALTRLMTALKSPRVGLAGPSTNMSWNEQAILPRASSTDAGLAAAAAEAYRRYGDSVRALTPLYSLADFCLAVRADVIEAIGAADKGFGLGPCWEMEYNARAARAGFTGVWVGAAFVHRAPFTRRRRIEEDRRFDASRRRYQDRLCALRLDGTADHYEDHCRGDGCPHFAPAEKIRIRIPLDDRPDSPVAPQTVAPSDPPSVIPSARGRVGNPTVSCVMPTADRPEFVAQAVRYLQRQHYGEWELIVVDDGTHDVQHVLGGEVDDARITWVRPPQAVSIGRKRNIGCERAHGEFIAHWDDDDWHGADRLRSQLAPLIARDATVTALRDALWFDVAAWRFLLPSTALHRRLFTADVHGGTLVFHRSVWEHGRGYPDCSLAEDAMFLQSALRRGNSMIALPAEGLFVYVRHGANTWRISTAARNAVHGWQNVAEPEYFAEDRDFYAEFSKAAPPTACSTSSQALVSCVMPTANRRQFLPTAIGCFLDQTYPARELVVVDDGEDPIEDLIPDDARIRYIRLGQRTVLGTKRNIAAEAARGELLAHWDDDDWSHSNRLTRQVASLNSADVCGLHQLLWWEPACQRAWRYRYPGRRPWVAGNTLAYQRDAWKRSPFRAQSVGEDTAFIWGPGHFSVQPLNDESLVIGTIHDRNTSRKVTPGSGWTPASVADVHRIMGMGEHRG
jgi:glycosyltransferase involved in cell wall biosynthesis